MASFTNVTVLNHPLVQHKLTLLRRKNTATAEFRRLMRELSLLMAYEVTRDLATETVTIETPLEATEAPLLSGKKLCFLSILRAGNGMLDGMLDLVPSARVGHIGLYRDPHTLVPIEYYLKMPDDVHERVVIVVDPMVATGHSAITAIARLQQAGVTQISFACLVAAPEGLMALADAHPGLPVYVAAIDRQLDDHGYIRPGLGDAGDRLYGTR
ncbi:MAG TPA: uracil phosphoribosyltransferase [Acetobacteraceae bacterium]|jgi:uracil phosphoribosyltransferase|nr:uracil phosphoribosyltransferase [Acetobacteraceae bacterium]